MPKVEKKKQYKPKGKQKEKTAFPDTKKLIEVVKSTSVKPSSSGASHGKGGGGGGSSVAGVEGSYMKNAQVYLACRNGPQLASSARVPDLLSYPTSVTKQTYTLEYPVLAGSVFTQLYFAPTLNTTSPTRGWSYRTGAAGAAFSAWATTSDPNGASSAANMALYRTVGYGVQILNVTPLLDRGGTIRMGRVPQFSAISNTQGTLSRDPRYQLYDLADSELSKKVVPWLPMDYESCLEFLLPADTSDKGGILFEIGPMIAEQLLEFVVHHHIEYIPGNTIASFTEASTAPGSASDVAVSQGVIDKMIGYAGGVFTPENALAAFNAAMKLWAGGGDTYGFGKGSSSIAGYGDNMFAKVARFEEAKRAIARRQSLPMEMSDLSEFMFHGRVYAGGIAADGTFSGTEVGDEDYDALSPVQQGPHPAAPTPRKAVGTVALVRRG